MTAPDDQAPQAEATQENAAPQHAIGAEPSVRRRIDFELDHVEPKVALFTTTSGDEASVENLERMLAGLRLQAEGGARLCSVILVQQDEEATRALAERLNPPEFVEMIAGGGRMSLSAARNAMLSLAADRRLIASDDVVAFPDDDSWYPKGLLTKIQYLFACDPFFDFFFCRYGSKPVECHLSRAEDAPSAQTVISNASSNTIFVRGRVANLLGGYDEDLGVGAKHKSGEDLDYALRAFLGADQSAYIAAPLVGHRDKNPAIRAKYFRGSLLVISRYAAKSSAMALALLRKLATGALLMATFRLGPREYFSSIWLAASEFGVGAKHD